MNKYCGPLIGFLLGGLSVVSLITTWNISKKQFAYFAVADAIREMELKTAIIHLRLEEYIIENNKNETMEVVDDVTEAVNILNIILEGGEYQADIVVPATSDPVLRDKINTIKSLLLDFRENAYVRVNNIRLSGAGTALDEQMDAIFKNFLLK